MSEAVDQAVALVGELPSQCTAVTIAGDIAVHAERIVAEAADGLGGLDNVVVTAVPMITGPLLQATRADIDRCNDVTVHGFPRDVARFLEATAKRTTLNRRLVTPAGVAMVIAALLGRDFVSVTGQTITIAGGYGLLA